MKEKDLPRVEILQPGDANDDPVSTQEANWQSRSWRALPAAAGLAVVAIVAVLALQARGTGGDADALRRWASGQHDDIDPPTGVVLPDVMCEQDPYDLGGVRSCLREAQRAGSAGAGHVRADFGYPDAMDHWFSIDADGRGTMTQRIVSVHPVPDVEGDGEILSWQLRTATESWRVWECDRFVFADETDVYPGVDCREGADDSAKPPAIHHSETRELTDAEREELVRAFACVYPDALDQHDC